MYCYMLKGVFCVIHICLPARGHSQHLDEGSARVKNWRAWVAERRHDGVELERVAMAQKRHRFGGPDSALADSRLTGDPTFLMGCWCERFQMYGPAITVIRQPSRLSSRQILREFDSLRSLDKGASHAIYHHTHLSDVQLSYPTRHPKLSFYCHGEGHV